MARHNNPLPLLSPFLLDTFDKAMKKKGWDVHTLAEKSKVSTNYVRKIVNGVLIPARQALKALCEAAELNFPDTWQALRQEQEGRQGDGATGRLDSIEATADASTISPPERSGMPAERVLMTNTSDGLLVHLPTNEVQAEVVRRLIMLALIMEPDEQAALLGHAAGILARYATR